MSGGRPVALAVPVEEELAPYRELLEGLRRVGVRRWSSPTAVSSPAQRPRAGFARRASRSVATWQYASTVWRGGRVQSTW